MEKTMQRAKKFLSTKKSSSGSSKRKGGVVFVENDVASVHELDAMTPELKKIIWYDPSFYDETKKGISDTISQLALRKINKGSAQRKSANNNAGAGASCANVEDDEESDEELCTRGLECRTYQGSVCRSMNREQARSALFGEQDRQLYSGKKDPDAIANAYGQCSVSCHKAAHELGLKDQKAVKSYLATSPGLAAYEQYRGAANNFLTGILKNTVDTVAPQEAAPLQRRRQRRNSLGTFSLGQTKQGTELGRSGSTHERANRGVQRYHSIQKHDSLRNVTRSLQRRDSLGMKLDREKRDSMSGKKEGRRLPRRGSLGRERRGSMSKSSGSKDTSSADTTKKEQTEAPINNVNTSLNSSSHHSKGRKGQTTALEYSFANESATHYQDLFGTLSSAKKRAPRRGSLGSYQTESWASSNSDLFQISQTSKPEPTKRKRVPRRNSVGGYTPSPVDSSLSIDIGSVENHDSADESRTNSSQSSSKPTCTSVLEDPKNGWSVEKLQALGYEATSDNDGGHQYAGYVTSNSKEGVDGPEVQFEPDLQPEPNLQPEPEPEPEPEPNLRPESESNEYTRRAPRISLNYARANEGATHYQELFGAAMSSLASENAETDSNSNKPRRVLQKGRLESSWSQLDCAENGSTEKIKASEPRPQRQRRARRNSVGCYTCTSVDETRSTEESQIAAAATELNEVPRPSSDAEPNEVPVAHEATPEPTPESEPTTEPAPEPTTEPEPVGELVQVASPIKKNGRTPSDATATTVSDATYNSGGEPHDPGNVWGDDDLFALGYAEDDSNDQYNSYEGQDCDAAFQYSDYIVEQPPKNNQYSQYSENDLEDDLKYITGLSNKHTSPDITDDSSQYQAGVNSVVSQNQYTSNTTVLTKEKPSIGTCMYYPTADIFSNPNANKHQNPKDISKQKGKSGSPDAENCGSESKKKSGRIRRVFRRFSLGSKQ